MSSDESSALADSKLADRKLEAEISKLTVERDLIALEYGVKKRLTERELASGPEHQIYRFFGVVGPMSVEACITVTDNWASRFPGKGITIVFNTPGGDIIDGLGLFDHLRHLDQNGTPITTVALGYAASMGAVLLQAGSTRIVSPNSFLMIHEASYGTAGKTSDMEDDVTLMKRMQEKLLKILAERSTLTVRQIKAKWARKDWWIDAEAAVELGFADTIR